MSFALYITFTISLHMSQMCRVLMIEWRNGRRKYTVVTIVGECIETDTQGYTTGSNPVSITAVT